MIGNSKISNPGAAGGLDIVADVLVEDGAVTEFGATGITFVDGGVYEFTATAEQNGAGISSFGWLFDGDGAGTNYLQTDRIRSNVSPGPTIVYSFQADNFFLGSSMGYTTIAGDKVTSSLRVRVIGTRLDCLWQLGVDTYSSTAVGRLQHGRIIYDSGTLPTQIGVLSSLASGIANGSTIKGVRLY